MIWLLNHIVDDSHFVAVNNNMKLNPRKCKTMNFGFQIEQVSSMKLLGVFMSEDITWVAHCDYVVKNANRRLYAPRQLKKCGAPPSDIDVV